MINIQQKIEKIRQKPEHVRMRYVWLYTGISMIIIIFIWMISFNQTAIPSKKKNIDTSALNNVLGDFQEQKKSITDIKTNLEKQKDLSSKELEPLTEN